MTPITATALETHGIGAQLIGCATGCFAAGGQRSAANVAEDSAIVMNAIRYLFEYGDVMASLNKAILIGNLGRDPESRYMPSGEQVVNVSIACTDTWKDKSGEKKERTEWVNLVFFGKVAEIAEKYLRKGSQVYVEGRLQTRKWQDKQGNDRYTTEVIVSEMKMLGGKQADAAPAHGVPDSAFNEDVPF